MFIDKLLFGPKPLSEREIASVRYAMKSERNQNTRVMELLIVCYVFVQKRVTIMVGMQLLPDPTLTSQILLQFPSVALYVIEFGVAKLRKWAYQKYWYHQPPVHLQG
jgi:hypothetical protein